MSNVRQPGDSNPDWQAETLRLSLFLSPTADTSLDLSWEKLTGELPESVESNPRLGTRQESGGFSSGVLALVVRPQRIDCVLGPRETDDISDVSFLSIAPFALALEQFRPPASRIIHFFPKVSRIALGVVLTHPVDQKIQGYKQLAEFLPSVKLDPDGMSDFLYRINRPRPSQIIDGLQLNRLCTWSAAARLNAHLPIIPVAPPTISQEVFARRVEMDINTAQDWKGDLPAAHLESIFGELVTLSIEIAERGDQP